MKLVHEEDLADIIRLLEPDIGNCVYMYMDIKKYGLRNHNMKIWINEGDTLSTVVMRYYDSLQVYSADKNAQTEEIAILAEKENIRMVYGEKQLVDRIFRHPNIRNAYEATEGYVYQFEPYREFPKAGIEKANPEDMEEIAELMCMDQEFGANYEVHDLARQLTERAETGMGRNYIIRKDGKIIAHIATFAEAEKIAVTSGLIVHPDYRNYPYGAMMESYLVNQLLEEGIKAFTFVNSTKRIKYLNALGMKMCGEYEKLVRK